MTPWSVLILLKNGMDANTHDNSNWTNPVRALRQGRLEVVQVLLDNGAKAKSQKVRGDNRDQTPTTTWRSEQNT